MRDLVSLVSFVNVMNNGYIVIGTVVHCINKRNVSLNFNSLLNGCVSEAGKFWLLTHKYRQKLLSCMNLYICTCIEYLTDGRRQIGLPTKQFHCRCVSMFLTNEKSNFLLFFKCLFSNEYKSFITSFL
jgi:hypothetical protein